jgi:glycerol uptake facilitator-like aquaporin
MNPNLQLFKKILPYFVALIVGAMLASCSCNYHLDKARQKCGSHTIKDTIHIVDTLMVASTQTDTIFKTTHTEHDTTIIREGRLTVKYFYNTHDSTVYLSGKCDTVKVIHYIDRIVDKTVLEVDWWDKFKWYIIIGGIIAALLYALKLYKK